VLCVKITQSMMGFGMFSPELVEVFKQNTHSVHVSDDEIDIITLNKLRKDYNIELPDKHFHAGMVAIAYLGSMNGKKVIVKLRRNGITERIRRGCEHTIFMYNFIDQFTIFSKNLKMVLLSLKSITQTTDYLISQCDFGNEIIAMQTSLAETKEYPQLLQNIIIPEVYNKTDDIEGTNFIVMEYLDGVFANELTDMDDRLQYLEDLLKYNVLMGWFFTYYHTDIHCGNVIYMKQDGMLKVGLIDFGMVVKTSESVKEGLRFIGDIQQKRIPSNEAYRALKFIMDEERDVTRNLTTAQKDYLNEKMGYLIDCTAKNELNEQVLLQTIDEISTNINQKIIINLDFFLVMISTTMFNSTLKVLAGYDTQLIESRFNKVMLEILD
jgi:RIO-like serine/threonine protein kinase